MSFTLPPLPYAFDALEPYIDAKTMEIHYTKHQQAYIDNLNKALENHPELQDKPLKELLEQLTKIPESIRTDVRNNGGGHLNHSLFWPMMKKNGGGEPKGPVAEAIKVNFGSFLDFKEKFNQAAKKRFGSGWAWLCFDKHRKLIILSTGNQDTPFTDGIVPILGIDVWEHAYYLKYQNRRPEYIEAWWHVVNWEQVEENYATFTL
jgi:superoxide dismutase, Fe-Mn family